MSDDAWSAPEAASVDQGAFRSLKGLSMALLGLFAVEAGLLVLMDVCNLLGAFVFPSALVTDDPSGADLAYLAAMAMTAFGLLGVICLALPLWVWWHWRAGQNLVALGRTELQHTPAGHAFWWFVPFANLVMPYRCTLELHKGSQPEVGPGDDWVLAPQPGLFVVWWGCWLAGNIIQNLSTRMGMVGLDEASVTLLGVVATPFALTALILYMRWVKEISDGQESLAGALSPAT